MKRVKYLVYYFDGTQQGRDRSETRDWSNIVRLHDMLAAHPPEGASLAQVYSDGVGCRGGEYVTGSLAGVGIRKRIEEAYYHLGGQCIKARTRGVELRIYVFGFSRGAYEARLFCQLVDFCGVTGGEVSYDEAMQWLETTNGDAISSAMTDGKLYPAPDIQMLGLFDTVAMTGYGSGVDLSMCPRCVKHVCHAMSYNERRLIFPLMRFSPGQGNVEEVWFLGSHTDVGGGYLVRGLADYTLRWMIEKAQAHGLPILESELAGDTATHRVQFNDSATAVQIAAGLAVKERESLVGDVFHWSVKDERVLFVDKVPPLPAEELIAYLPKASSETMRA